MSYRCPYCFTEHSNDDVEFRCSNSLCKGVVDQKLAAFESGNPDVFYGNELKGNTFRNPAMESGVVRWISRKFMPQKGVCPECGHETFQRICPDCHMNLYPGIENHTVNKTIAIIGCRDAGKSMYIGTLVDSLQKNAPRLFQDGSFAPVSETGTEEHYRTYYGDIIIKEDQTVGMTAERSGNRDTAAKRPLIYRLTVRENCTVMLIIYDNAGEDLQKPVDEMDRWVSNLKYADALLMLVDPCRLPAVRVEIGKTHEEILKASSTLGKDEVRDNDQQDMISRVADLINNHGGKRKTKRIPLAVAISKADIMEKLEKYTYQLEDKNFYREYSFHEEEAATDSETIKAILSYYGGTGIVNNIQNYFPENHCYFGISSIGHAPRRKESGERKLDHVVPRGIYDPFLWILSRLDII